MPAPETDRPPHADTDAPAAVPALGPESSLLTPVAPLPGATAPLANGALPLAAALPVAAALPAALPAGALAVAAIAASAAASQGTAPQAPTRGLDDLYDIGRLARRLGVEHATIRVWLSRRVPWLPPPDGRLNGGAVWRATTLEGIEERRAPGRPGRKPKFVPAPASADVPRTNPSPTGPAGLPEVPTL